MLNHPNRVPTVQFRGMVAIHEQQQVREQDLEHEHTIAVRNCVVKPFLNLSRSPRSGYSARSPVQVGRGTQSGSRV